MNIGITRLPLNLESYFFADTEVHFVPLRDKKEKYRISPDINVSTGISENETKKQVTVTVESKTKDDEGKSYNMSFKISAVGSFVNTSTEEETEEIKNIIYAHAVSMLIGAVRDYLATLTAKGPFGTYFLPSLMVSVKPEKVIEKQ